jgi:N-acyl-phosphatidylethanolamine-hydrolysing phospholipase D
VLREYWADERYRFGPKRYTPVPCTVADLPDIDALVISHNHYDHLDFGTMQQLFTKQSGMKKPKVFCALGNKRWFLDAGVGIVASDVVELDWWEGAQLDVEGVGSVDLYCTPCQHTSARSGGDTNKALWCSWVIREAAEPEGALTSDEKSIQRSLFFAGDTAYRTVKTDDPTPEEEAAAPTCPAFKEIGSVFGPFDLALLPIGLFLPRHIMSPVHCSPEDSAEVHKDIKAKRSIGMHYGTVRGGLSGQYEDVRVPPQRWRKVCEGNGWKWRGESQNDSDWEAGLCDVGETVVIR